MKKNQLLIGITIDKFKGIKPSTLLTIVRKLGLEFVEITNTVFNEIEQVKAALGDVQTGFHLPYLHDDNYDFSTQSYASKIQEMIALINQHADDLNINYCLSHPPEAKNSKQSWEERTDFLLENLKKLKLPVILENVQGISEDQFNILFEKAKNALGEKLIGQCFDAAHYFLSGNDPVVFIDQSNSKIKCVHLSDCKQNFDAHLPFGVGGNLPIAGILAALKKNEYHGYINLELLPRSLSDIKHVIYSYLQVVQTFNRRKHFFAKLRLIVFSSKLKRIVKTAF